MIDSSLLLLKAVVILIFFVVMYWPKMTLFLLDHGSNVSFTSDPKFSCASSFDIIAAANARDNGSISTWDIFDERGSKMVDVDGVSVCGLFVVV